MCVCVCVCIDSSESQIKPGCPDKLTYMFSLDLVGHTGTRNNVCGTLTQKRWTVPLVRKEGRKGEREGEEGRGREREGEREREGGRGGERGREGGREGEVTYFRCVETT